MKESRKSAFNGANMFMITGKVNTGIVSFGDMTENYSLHADRLGFPEEKHLINC